MTTGYRVIITQIERDVPFKNKEYKQISDSENDDKKYGYVYFDDTKDKSEEVFNQLVPDIDIVSVIAAVNNVKRLEKS